MSPSTLIFKKQTHHVLLSKESDVLQTPFTLAFVLMMNDHRFRHESFQTLPVMSDAPLPILGGLPPAYRLKLVGMHPVLLAPQLVQNRFACRV